MVGPAPHWCESTSSIARSNCTAIRSALDYTLQLGSFSQLENAQQLRDRVGQAFADVSIAPLQSKDTTYYRVHLGTFSNRTDAEEQARQVDPSRLLGHHHGEIGG